MFVSFSRLKDEPFGKYNLPVDWEFEIVNDSLLQFLGPSENTDEVKNIVYLKFMELKYEGVVSVFRIFDKN